MSAEGSATSVCVCPLRPPLLETPQSFVSAEAKIPVFGVKAAAWLQKNPYNHFMFISAYSIVSFGLSNCPRVWVPVLIAIGAFFDVHGLPLAIEFTSYLSQ